MHSKIKDCLSGIISVVSVGLTFVSIYIVNRTKVRPSLEHRKAHSKLKTVLSGINSVVSVGLTFVSIYVVYGTKVRPSLEHRKAHTKVKKRSKWYKK